MATTHITQPATLTAYERPAYAGCGVHAGSPCTQSSSTGRLVSVSRWLKPHLGPGVCVRVRRHTDIPTVPSLNGSDGPIHRVHQRVRRQRLTEQRRPSCSPASCNSVMARFRKVDDSLRSQSWPSIALLRRSTKRADPALPGGCVCSRPPQQQMQASAQAGDTANESVGIEGHVTCILLKLQGRAVVCS